MRDFDLSESFGNLEFEATPIDLTSEISTNKKMFSGCDSATSAEIINHEDNLSQPITAYMSNPDMKAKDVLDNMELENYQTQNLSGVMRTIANARLYSMYNPLRQEIAEKEKLYRQTMFDESGVWNRFKNSFMASKYSMEKNALEYKLADAERNGDDAQAAVYNDQIYTLNEKLSSYMMDEGVTGTTANIIASIARNPELIGIGLGAGLISTATGGTATPFIVGGLTTMAEGSIIFSDTFKVEAGEMLETLKEKHPEMSNEERLNVAEDYGFIAALEEVALTAFTPLGWGVRRAYSAGKEAVKGYAKKVANKARIESVVKAGKGELLKKFSGKAISKNLTDVNSLAYIGGKIFDHVKAAIAEGGQEVSQEITKDAFLKAVADAEEVSAENLLQNAKDNMMDESERGKYVKLFVNTTLGSLIVSGTGSAVSKSSSYSYNKMLAQSASMDVETISKKIMESKKNSTAYKMSKKAYNEQTKILSDVGSAPEQVVFSDVEKLEQIKEEAKAKGETEIVARMEDMGLTDEILERAKKSTGEVKVDFAKFDDAVLDPDNQELFQKVNGLYTFDENTLPKKEMEVLFEDLINKRPEIRSAIGEKDSVFNVVITGLSKNKNFTPKQVINNATLAQLQANRMMEFEGKSPEEVKKVALNIVNMKESKLGKIMGLFQKSDQHIAGVYTREGKENLIRLTEAANPTTFMHEFNHLFMTEALDSYNSGAMTEYWKKKVEALAKWAGAEVVDGKINLTEAQMEKIAEGFTMYLKEGKAPVESLTDIFARMAEWFMDVYKRLRMSNVRLNKSVREAFDAMLVSEEEINDVLIDKQVQAIGRREGVTEEQYQRYLSDLAVLRRDSTNKHLEAIRRKSRTELESKNLKKKEEIRESVTKELEQNKEYQLRAAIRNFRINTADIPENLKLSNKGLFVSENGLPIQQFITQFSDIVSNVGDVVDLLNRLRPPSAVIEERTNTLFEAWLLEENPELADIDARIATNNKNLIKVRLKEYLMLKGLPLESFNKYYEELVNATDAEIASMPISYFMNTDKLLQLETRIMTKARFAKNDNQLADALWHQAALSYVISEAKKIKGKVNSFNRHFDKYKRAPTDGALKKIDAYDFDMISAILYNYKFTGRKPRVRDIPLAVRLENWVVNKTENRFSDADVIVDYIPELSENKNLSNFNRLSYEDFSRLNNMMRVIEGISQSDKVQTEFDKRTTRLEDADLTVAYLNEKKITQGWIANTWNETVVMTETLLKNILPEDMFLKYVSPFTQSIINRDMRVDKLDEALGKALTETAKRRDEIIPIKFNKKWAAGTKEINLNMTYEELQVAVLNADNLETWIDSYNFQRGNDLTEADYISIVSQAPQEMWDTARQIWDLFESQKAEFREAQYKTSGFLMDYVEPRKIILSNGTEIQTGYYPRSAKVSPQAFDQMMQGDMSNSGKNMGTAANAKDRKALRHRDLDLSIESLKPWMYHTATVIEVGAAYNALNSLLTSDEVRLRIGDRAEKMFNNWMQYSIVGDHVNKLFSALDHLSSVQILGWDYMKFVIQALGFIPAIASVGIKYIAPQFMKARTYAELFDIESMKQLSPYMKARYERSERYIANITDNYRVVKMGKTIKDKITDVAMYFTLKGDAFASGVVWNGAYEKAIDEGRTKDEAVFLADYAVRTSQGDNSTVSRPPILQGNARFITKFASYFLAQNSKISAALVGRNYLEAVTNAALAGILAPIIESIFKSMNGWFIDPLVAAALGKDPEDEKKKLAKKGIHDFSDYALDAAKKNIWSTLGMLSMPVAGIGAKAGTILAYGKNYQNELPMLGYAGSMLNSVYMGMMLVGAEDEKERKKYKKELIKSTGQVLTIPKKYVNMFVTD